jgi:hypothetical protein
MKRERRAHERHSIRIEATLDTPDRRGQVVRLRDVSFSGALVMKTDPSMPFPSIGTEVQITIRYQSERGAEVETVAARVVRVCPDGLAVEFLREPAAQSGAA